MINPLTGRRGTGRPNGRPVEVPHGRYHTFLLSPENMEEIEHLRRRWGLENRSQTVRQAIRRLAEERWV